MGNDSSKSSLRGTPGKKKSSLGFKSGPSTSTIKQHLETAQKSRVLQLRGCGMKALPDQLQEVRIFRVCAAHLLKFSSKIIGYIELV